LSPDFLKGGQRADCLLLGAGEHPCVLTGHRFPTEQAKIVKIGDDGRLDLDHLRETLSGLDGARPMLALQMANNETGVVQPVTEAAAMVAQAGGWTLCDAVQAAGRIVVDRQSSAVDALILSAHKFGGPKGIGALIFDNKTMEIRSKLIRGGGQEKGHRAGTENVAGIAGFGAAAAAALAELGHEEQRLLELRQQCEQRLLALAPDLVLFGKQAPRLPNTLAFAIPGLSAETLLMALDLAGISISSGSACSSGKVQASHVLAAMGIAPELAKGALRISMGWSTTPADIDGLCLALQKVLSTMRVRRPVAVA
jgi:cysteine desulfurase